MLIMYINIYVYNNIEGVLIKVNKCKCVICKIIFINIV